MTVGIAELARAKVNLTLHVGARIPSGNWENYHPVESLVVFADFGDELIFSEASNFSAKSTGPFSGALADVDADQNSVIQALNLCGKRNVSFTVDKQIPVAAGLGGGTADAAAVLRRFDADGAISSTQIGADGPICRLSQTAMIEGIGEIVTPLPGLGQLSAVLVNPGVAVSTGKIFQAMDSSPRAVNPAKTARDGSLLSRALSGQNDMEDAAISQAPIIADVLRALAQPPGCELARMSGSGASCFGIFRSDAQATAAAQALLAAHSGWWVRACRLGDMP